MQAREGDLIKTKDRIVFDVKGLVHPPGKVIAFPRFIPSSEGTRGSKGNLYGKVYNLAERFKYLETHAPDLIVIDPVFGETLCEVPVNTIEKHYDPVKNLHNLRSAKRLGDLERKAVFWAEKLKATCHIPWDSIGISGSIMAGLCTVGSDIDPMVYGAENCRKAYDALKGLLVKSGSNFAGYTQEELRTLFEFRSKDTVMSFEDFVAVESKKAFQGKFMGTDYFVRFVKNWSEINERYGDVCYTNCGYVRIEAKVADDSESLFTPCTYLIENVHIVEGPNLSSIREIASFRGRFCEQAAKGEMVMAQGKVEKVTNKKTGKEHYRILLGNKPADYMALLRR